MIFIALCLYLYSPLFVYSFALYPHGQRFSWTVNSSKYASKTSQAPLRSRRKTRTPGKGRTTIETWRIFDVKVHPDDLAKEVTMNEGPLPPAVRLALEQRFPTPSTDLVTASIVRRSLDARTRKGVPCPFYKYTIDATVKIVRGSWKEQPGRRERLCDTTDDSRSPLVASPTPVSNAPVPAQAPVVVIVGAGPAGLFCAMELVQSSPCRVILLEQGQPVERRGKDIGALMHRRVLNAHSNFCFGEGGAGTWSDGKLTTRIGRNAGPVRHVVETLIRFGAPERIRTEGAPHLGTDTLVRLLRQMRAGLIEKGVEIRFGTKVTQLLLENGAARGVQWERTNENDGTSPSTTGRVVADAVILATGHSSRETYEQLHASGVVLEPKGFAVGFRVEHPQKLITKIQYGKEWGPSVITGKKLTDQANQEYFEVLRSEETPRHIGRLPVPSYRLATQYAHDGTRDRGCYSFCMCPGGQIVPASTNPEEVCVNGMSFSRRDSPFANSALVVTISTDDPLLEPYREQHGVLAGIEFQKDMERRAASMGGGDLTVPVQRLTDFLDGRHSSSGSLASSYRLGVRKSPNHQLYPAAITNALRHSLVDKFDKAMPGFVSDDGVLHGVETRTSSPLRVLRDEETLEAEGIEGLFPAGEGAGFAGGIVSAAVDGLQVARAVQRSFGLKTAPSLQRTKSPGANFHY